MTSCGLELVLKNEKGKFRQKTRMEKTKIIGGFPFVPHQPAIYGADEMQKRSAAFLMLMQARRSVRQFSRKLVPKSVIENVVQTAATAPSGAHKQPWTFCLVQDALLKKQIRQAAEEEEKESYGGRMPASWLADLAPLQTDWKKEFLEEAPWLIVVFKHSYQLQPDGSRSNTYYATESCGLACGFLLAAIHNAGLVALTHTPSPMGFLKTLLQRPENEKPFLLIPVGYAADETWVPHLQRKQLYEVAVWY